MITKDGSSLLDQMRRNEIEKHAFGKEVGLLTITNITACFNKLLSRINRTPNSTFIIRNESESMEIVLRNEVTDPYHSETYVVTIANSSQTFKVEQVLVPITKHQTIIISDYEEQFS